MPRIHIHKWANEYSFYLTAWSVGFEGKFPAGGRASGRTPGIADRFWENEVIIGRPW
jgi:hypothetical protein